MGLFSNIKNAVKNVSNNIIDNYNKKLLNSVFNSTGGFKFVPKSLLNVKGHEGKTALHHALASNSNVMAKALIYKGADIILHDAVRNGDLETFNKLIDAGADVNVRDKNNMTPLHYVTLKFQTKQGVEFLKPEEFKSYKTMFSTLINKGANVNAQNNGGETPLFFMTNEAVLGKNTGGYKGYMYRATKEEQEKGEVILELLELLINAGANTKGKKWSEAKSKNVSAFINRYSRDERDRDLFSAVINDIYSDDPKLLEGKSGEDASNEYKIITNTLKFKYQNEDWIKKQKEENGITDKEINKRIAQLENKQKKLTNIIDNDLASKGQKSVQKVVPQKDQKKKLSPAEGILKAGKKNVKNREVSTEFKR